MMIRTGNRDLDEVKADLNLALLALRPDLDPTLSVVVLLQGFVKQIDAELNKRKHITVVFKDEDEKIDLDDHMWCFDHRVWEYL